MAGSAAAAITFAGQGSAPSEQQAAAVAELAIGQAARNLAGPVVACTYFCPEQWQPSGDQVITFDDPFEENEGVDHVTVVYWTPGELVAAAVDDAKSRLDSAGWDVGTLTIQDDGTRYFSASKDGLSLSIVAVNNTAVGPSLQLRFERALPGLPAVAIAGLFVGLLAGWMLTAWVLQRLRRHDTRVKVAAMLSAIPMLMVVALTDLLLLQFSVAIVLSGGRSVPAGYLVLVPANGMAVLLSIPGLSVIAAVTLTTAAAAFGLAALPIRTRINERRLTPAD